MTTHQLTKQIGLLTGVAFVVGSVIGMGAFVLIPLICAKAYGAAWLSITIALVVCMLNVFPIIQLSAAYPVAGGGYEYGNAFFNKSTGIVFSSWALVGGAASVALVAYGLVESFQTVFQIPFSNHLLSLIIMVLFWGVFLTGVKTIAAMQVVLVVQTLLALLLFAIPTLANNWDQVVFSLPSEGGSFFMSIIFAFNISLGFQIIMELGEEMENPKRNIPLSLFIGGGIVWLIYILVTAAYIGVVGIENITTKPEMVNTASSILPNWALILIRVGIISAGLTCFIGSGMGIPREVFALARAKIIPEKYAEVSTNGTPKYAVNIFFTIVCSVFLIGELFQRIGIMDYFFGKDVIEFYSYITIFGIMALSIGISLASLKLKKMMPDAYENAYIKFHPTSLIVLVIIAVIASLFLIVLVSMKWVVPLLFILITLFVIIWYKQKSIVL